MAVEFGANYTKSADNGRRALAYIALAGNVVKVQPLAALALNNALCAQNQAVFFIGKSRKNAFELFSSILFGRFCTKADKHFIGVVMVMVTVFMTVMVAIAMRIVALVIMLVVVLMMLMVVTRTFGIITFMLVVVLVVFLALVMVVMMVVTFTLFVITFIVMMVMVMLVMALPFIMMMVMVVMVVAMAIRIVAFVLIMVMVNVSRKACEFLFNGIAALHSCQKLCTVENIPSGSNNGCGGILFAQKRYGFGNLFFGCALCV